MVEVHVTQAHIPSTHQPYYGSSSAWEIERVKGPWTAFQARAITERREK